MKKLVIVQITFLTIAASLLFSLGWWLVKAFTFGLIISQQVLFGIYAACYELPAMIRLRWFYRLLACQWLALTVPSATVTREWPMPFSIIAMQMIIFAGALIGAVLFGLVTRRTIASTRTPTPIYRLLTIDLFILTAVLAVVISVGIRFQDPVPQEMFAGVGYIFMVWGSLLFGASLALILFLTSIGFLTNNDRIAIFWMRGWIVGIGIAVVTIFLAVDSEVQMAWLAFVAGVGLSLFLSMLVLRKTGLRIRKRQKASIDHHY